MDVSACRPFKKPHILTIELAIHVNSLVKKIRNSNINNISSLDYIDNKIL